MNEATPSKEFRTLVVNKTKVPDKNSICDAYVMYRISCILSDEGNFTGQISVKHEVFPAQLRKRPSMMR